MTENLLDTLSQNPCLPADQINPCTCMYCDNRSSVLGIPMPRWMDRWLIPDSWLDRSLAKGKCGFYKCNYSNFNGWNGTNISRFFMVGQGQTFFEYSGATLTNDSGANFTGGANALCSSQLKMAVRWMLGNELHAPYAPSEKQAGCLLHKDVMPLYIYYTNGSNINETASREIAHALKGVGPVFITTEANFNGSNPAVVDAVVSQLNASKDECPNCLTVLAARDMNDSDIAAVYEEISSRGQNPSTLIDAIGQGFILNEDADSCDIDVLIGKRLSYAKETILRNYGKPVLWMYVGMSPGPTALAGCNWTNSDIARGYLQLHTNQQAMVDSGIIGVAPYQLADARDILPCNAGDCNFGLADSDFKFKQPQAAAWFSTCADIFNAGNVIPIVYSTNGTSAFCSFAQGWATTRRVFEYGEEYELPSEMTGYYNISFRCPSCISYDEEPPGDWVTSHASIPEENCTRFPQIDLNAEIADTDPFLLRAVALQESALDPCAISWTRMGNSGCNDPPQTLEQIFGPSPTCPSTGQPIDTTPWKIDGTGECSPTGTGADCKPCAYGLLQCIEKNGSSYPPGSLPDAIKLCGGTQYSPLSPGDSACCGSVKLSEYIHDAEEFVSTHYSELGLSGDDDQDAYVAIFLGLLAYHGDQYLTWFSEFDSNGHICPADGSQYDNFIEYIIECKDGSYAQSVLGYYDALRGCDSYDCAGREINNPYYVSQGGP
jgi:hypothetical protein